MKFIVDAHFPYHLAKFIRAKGLDTLHTDDLPLKERTSDREIRRIAAAENRVVISKDSDFLDSHLLQNNPKMLLLVTTGNIRNPELVALFEENWDEIMGLFKVYDYLELSNAGLSVPEK